MPSEADAEASTGALAHLAQSDGLPPCLAVTDAAPVQPFGGFHLLRSDGEDAYRGAKTPLQPPPLTDLLALPQRGDIGTVEDACAALEVCKETCASLLERAYSTHADGGGSARLVMQSHVIEVITELFAEVLPTPAAPGRPMTAPLSDAARGRKEEREGGSPGSPAGAAARAAMGAGAAAVAAYHPPGSPAARAAAAAAAGGVRVAPPALVAGSDPSLPLGWQPVWKTAVATSAAAADDGDGGSDGDDDATAAMALAMTEGASPEYYWNVVTGETQRARPEATAVAAAAAADDGEEEEGGAASAAAALSLGIELSLPDAPPLPLEPAPAGWTALQDPATGMLFFWNAATGATQYERPPPAAAIAPPPPPPPTPPPTPPAAAPAAAAAATDAVATVAQALGGIDFSAMMAGLQQQGAAAPATAAAAATGPAGGLDFSAMLAAAAPPVAPAAAAAAAAAGPSEAEKAEAEAEEARAAEASVAAARQRAADAAAALAAAEAAALPAGATPCVWRQPMTAALQLKLMRLVVDLANTFGNMWQDVDEPSRGYESRRAVVATAMLAVFDVVVRAHATDEPLELSAMLAGENGGYSLSLEMGRKRDGKPLEKVTEALELLEPAHTRARDDALAYLGARRAKAAHVLFQMPLMNHGADGGGFTIELLKWSAETQFLRTFVDRCGYEVMPRGQARPPTEMDALVNWFCAGEEPPYKVLAEEHPEWTLLVRPLAR